MRKKETIKNRLLLLLLSLMIVSCTEPYALQTNTFEDAIVVEATLSNELKKQEIKLSRTYMLEQNGPTFEANAVVFVTDDSGNQYDYEEVDGKYVSTSEFQAEPDRNYQLHIITDDGKSFLSSNQKLTAINQIESLNTSIETIDEVRGVQIKVNSNDPTNSSKYYRYEYEETSKIVAPKWSPDKAILLNQPRICQTDAFQGFKSISVVPREIGESKVCYSTKNSIGIIQTSTNNLSEDRVIDFPIRFISDKDYTIAERYSIQVKQYIQTLEAYTYFSTLKKISGSPGSLLSQNQPGFLYGNVKSVTNPSEKVIGFFEVASVSSKRIFFNFHDIFPGEDYPAYITDCESISYDSMYFGDRPSEAFPCGNGGPGVDLRLRIQEDTELYFTRDLDIYYMVHPFCGDCTRFSSNIKPTFWID